MPRFAVAFMLAIAAATSAATEQASRIGPRLIGFDVTEATIYDMQKNLQTGRVTSKELVLQSLARTAVYQRLLNPVITVNQNAIAEAELLDVERAQGRVRGPLRGIPVALKDNILTRSMPTSGGALAFRGYFPPYDATLVANLKNAGAVIVAKTVMTELANWVTNGMPGNYSAVGGWGMNPYDPRPDPRPGNDGFNIPFADGRPAMSVAGSSSGIGTAASPYHNPAMQKDKTIILYCASGGRSALAAKTLLDMGYTAVYNAGGFNELAAAGLETEPA
jgi:rhodanese-related sulfurtransferase